jgi:hydrogenase expression/formation protein HypC
MKILKIDKDSAVVSTGGVKRTIAINFLTKAKVGDYVIVHAGFAIQKLDPKKARETLRIFKELE